MTPLSTVIGAAGARLILYDLEFTAWPGSHQRGWSGPGEHREIVQIGAVALDLRRGMVEQAAFERIIRPARNPVLSDYFIDLTGISQARVEAEGVALPQALADFVAFVGPQQTLLASFGPDDRVIRENCALARCPYPFTEAQAIDIRRALLGALGISGVAVSSYELPGLAGLPAAGRAHDALADARAMAAVLRHLMQSSPP